MVEALLDFLYELLEAELKSDSLEQIPKTIYREVAAQMKELRSNGDDERNIANLFRARERELLYRLASRLLSVRVKKIFENPEYEVEGENILSEEKYLLEPIFLHRRRFNRVERAIWNGQISVLESLSEKVTSKYMVVRFLQATSTFIGTDLAKYGPFEPEDVAVIPVENVKALLKRGAVSEIWIEE